jgi:hypothetical protein
LQQNLIDAASIIPPCSMYPNVQNGESPGRGSEPGEEKKGKKKEREKKKKPASTWRCDRR